MDMNYVFLHMWNFDLVTFGELLEALADYQLIGRVATCQHEVKIY